MIEPLNARLEAASNHPDLPKSEGQPFEGLQRALEAGRLSVQPDDSPRVREYFPDYTSTSSVQREERIRFGGTSPQQAFWRTQPRA